MPRSSYKGPFVDPAVIRVVKRSAGSHAVIKIWSRSSVILPDFVGKTFGVHNGKKFVPVNVSEDMVGRKFGEFSPTRTYTGHSAGDKKAKKR